MAVYDNKTISVVTPYNGSPVNYGWSTNISDADQAQLGHQTLSAAEGPVVFGASRPKPARMSKETITDTTSSFVDWQSYASAIDQGWKKIKGVSYGPSPYNSAKAIRVVAEVAPNLSIAWDMRKTQYTRVQTDLAALGVEVLTQTNGKHAVVGANSVQGASLFGAKTRLENDTLTVGYVGRTQVDNLPEGWTAFSRNSGGDPTIAAP